MDGADAPNVNGAGGTPKAVGIVAGGNAMFEASPDVYPVSMVEVGESIPKLAPPSATGLLGNDGVGVGVVVDAAPNIKGAGAVDAPKEKAGAESAPAGTGVGAGAVFPNEKGAIAKPAAASGFEAAGPAAPNTKGAGVVLAPGAGAGAPKVKAGRDSELDGVVTAADETEPKAKGAAAVLAATVGVEVVGGSNPAPKPPKDAEGVVAEGVVVEGTAPKLKGAGEEAVTAVVAGTEEEEGKPNVKLTDFLLSSLAEWLPKVPAPDEEGAVAVLRAAGNKIGATAVLGTGAGILVKPVKLAAAEGITIVAAGALVAPKENAAGFTAGAGSAALVRNVVATAGCVATVEVTVAAGAPKVKGADEDEGGGTAKAAFGAGTPALDTRLFSQERHFTEPLGFCTRQVWHFTRSEEAAIAHRDPFTGSVVAAAGTATGAGTAAGTDTGVTGAKEKPTIGAVGSF